MALTEKQEQFAINYYTIGLIDTFGNATESARKAGYGDENSTDNYLATVGKENIRKPQIIARKEQIQADIREEYAWNEGIAREVLLKAYALAVNSGNVKDIVAVSRELSAITGLHVQTVQTKDLSAPVVSVDEQAELDILAARYKVKLANTR